MAVQFSPTAPLEGTLTVTISDSEYQNVFNRELNNYKNKAQLKGFRKGKTPTDVIKKLYGSAILQEVIEKSLQNQLLEYIKENKLNILGQPLTNADQLPISYDIQAPSAFVFKFDIGYTEEFEIQGLDNTYEIKKVIADEKTVNEQYEKLRERNGDLQVKDGPVQKEDLISIKAAELDESNNLKENGVSVEFTAWLSQIDEEAKKLFIDKMNDVLVDADIKSFHPDKDEAFIKQRYFPSLPDGSTIPTMMRMHIHEIKTTVPALENQEFFDKMFGPGAVSSAEEAKKMIKDELEVGFEGQADALLFRDIQDGMLKANNIAFPEAFLKRWLKTQNPNLADNTVDAEFPAFKENLVWTLMRDKIIEKNKIQVSADEVRTKMRMQFMSYFGGYAMGDMSFLNSTIDKMMQNREQVDKMHDEILTDKVFDNIKSTVTLQSTEIDETAFKALMEAARKDSADRRKQAQAHLEHTHDHGHEHHDHDHDHDHNHDHSHKH